jgi:threonyl-tRNA synthetase
MSNKKIIRSFLIKIDGKLIESDTDYDNQLVIEEVDPLSEEALHVYRHSAAHLMAHAVTELYPEVQYGIGPAIENGFYYDFITPQPFTPDDLQKISKKMKQMVKQNLKISKKVWTRKQAVEYFESRKQDLKIELINEKIDKDDVSVYQQGEFVDLCRGPHVPSTSFLTHFKLLSVAASYWKGDENNHSMQRIYGIVFPTREQLEAYETFLLEAKKRDHRKLGRDLDLFSIQNDIGAGLVLWHPKGGIIRYEIEKYWREEHIRGDYDLLATPHIAKIDLWNTSGHTDFYRENMFSTIDLDNTQYQLKPMNCPFHIVIYKSRNRSYRDLPLRWAELGTVYRYERSGVLHGLMRVRGFTQDDAHIFCSPDQLEDEVKQLIEFSTNILKTFGFEDMDIFLSTRPDKFVGKVEDWELATAALEKSLRESGIDYQVDPGEGVFYGPKIDIKIKDVLNRSWQLSTIQVDFNLPKGFQLKYSDDQGNVSQPIVIHRALLGSLERFFGILIEHYGGFFPLWLAPVQAMVIPITERNLEYARTVFTEMKQNRFRIELDERSEGVGKKIRDAELQKIPYIIIVGDEEQKQNNVSFRIHKKGDQGKIMLDRFITSVNKIIGEKGFRYEIY